MSYSTHYGGLIFTKHAIERMQQRSIPQNMVWEAFNKPDKTFPGKQPGSTEYQKQFGKSLVTLIVRQNEKREWIVVSCWMDPPLPGTIDYMKKERYKEYQKAGFWRKMWLTLKSQLGL